MHTRGGMNYEYANPMAFNINNKNIGSMSHGGSPTVRPVPINYQGYTSQNTSVVSFNNQNNINSSDNSNFYIQRYKNPENAKSSLKYSTTQYIPKNKIDERNEMISIRKHRNYINDNNENINNRPNQNSVALPANYSSYNRLPINSYYANGTDHATQNNEIKLTYDKIGSLNKPERIKSMTTPNNMEVDNPNYEEKLQKTKNVYIQDPQKNNNFEIKMKRDEKISNLSKQYLITKEKDEAMLLDNINHSRNVIFAKSPRNNTNSPIYDILDTNKKLRIQNQFGNERKATAKNEIEYKGKRERDLYNKLKGGIENRKGEYLYKENNDMEDTKKLNIKEVQKYNNMSLKNDEKKNERKMNILKNKKVNGKSIDNDKKKLECIVSMNFKEDAFDLKNGLKAFKNIIIIDRNNVIKKWNGYEWIKLENDFHFFIKARYDNKGNIWLINNSYEILKLKDNKYKKYGNIANEEIVDIGFDKKNILWCINRKGDLLKWDKTQWKRIKYSGFHKLISLAFDIKGNLWGLNSKRILALWNTKNKCWDEKIINSELKISSMDFDKDGKIWAISNNGALLTYVSNQWINFGYVCLDELISISFRV
ncbi:thioredoxin-like associated protein 2, putative [Plasmodium vinckei brucechwatti]|uniref:Thioredoxin-like associated protein 2, putative n=1 Tax=Plasmodium vinckei brucechwatti TaxID=119398 RepID=A0A6V7RXE7_PLAVN|nr:thioredoxin-like associated protein 2, putative [Plasmodium vinckei brucechwatti]